MNWANFTDTDLKIVFWIFLYCYLISRFIYDLAIWSIETFIRLLLHWNRKRAFYRGNPDAKWRDLDSDYREDK